MIAMMQVKRGWALLLLSLGAGAGATEVEPATPAPLRMAAQQHDASAQFQLAQSYRSVDELESLYWNGRAAQQGHAEAQLNQGLHYSSGRLFPPDLVQAYMWLSLAAARDQPLAQPVIRQIMAKMSRDEIAEAEQRLESWERTFGSEASWSCGEASPVSG